ncbi:hypothetical protein TARUN_6129 [Trichoderma arundinaceum]|uniref:Uncharacterized protein n=1 Tax=Trichoderma arundinaceum TaxID=490622 RepID=A0A395NJ87_TRIAR|nr:hypothetical protein TARUN_6129 [Trichoderma arundinaceum]
MASRKPDFHLQMPAMSQSDLQYQSRSPMRSPRFREDFDAPFSESFLDPPPPKTSYFVESKDKVQPPPQRSFDDSWVQVPKRRESVNGKVLQWAKRSLTIKRQRPSTRAGDGLAEVRSPPMRSSRRISSLPMETGYGKRNTHAQPPTIITVAEIPKSV